MILQGDAKTVLSKLDDNSFHCCVTSPPYYGLRDYGVDGQIGMEKTPEEYVKNLVEVFREVRRVLRDDGTFWLNIGDSYWGGKGQSAHGNPERHIARFAAGETINKPHQEIGRPGETLGKDGKHPEIKPKDLIGIPWLLAFALRADGWYLRADLPWIKRNAMPSSVQDRPASSIEHVFLFSKSKKYYYDYVATMQPSSESYNKDKRPRGVIRQCVNAESKYPDEGQFKKQDHTGNNTYTGSNARWKESRKEFDSSMGGGGTSFNGHSGNFKSDGTPIGTPGLRYMRDSDFFFKTWQGLMHSEDGEPMALVVNPRGYKGAHFACFPVQLVEPMILAGTSEKGVCPVCGAPWVRETKKSTHNTRPGTATTYIETSEHFISHGSGGNVELANRPITEIETTCWHPSCTCQNNTPVPATVFDPFSGSASTGVACQWHNRDFIGIELKPEYCILANKRLLENK